MLPVIDLTTQLVTDRSTLPVCSNCGGPVFMNVRGGNWFIEHPYKAEADAINSWQSENRNKTLEVLEIGAGFNTPGVIRLPMETVATQFSNATLIRINKDHPQGPEGTISIQAPAHEALSELIGKVHQCIKSHDCRKQCA